MARKHVAIIIGILLINTLAHANGSPVPRMDPPPHRTPAINAAVLYLEDRTTLNNIDDLRVLASRLSGSRIILPSRGSPIWDLGGGVLDGIKQSGDGGQEGRQEALIRVKMPLVIRNGFIRNNKDALSFYAPDGAAESLTWLTVGEDAVATSKGAYRMRVENCEFINQRSGDKSIQLNDATDAIIKNNLIFSGRTCIRVGDDHTTEISDRNDIIGNRFVGCDTAIHASKITTYESKNTFIKVNKRYISANGAIFK